VLVPVEFYDQTQSMMSKICNVWTDWSLSTKVTLRQFE